MSEQMLVTCGSGETWGNGEFEHTVATALIAGFETKVKRHKGCPPADRLTEERIAMVRSFGLYIPSPSRILVAPTDFGANWTFDVGVERLPVRGFVAHVTNELQKQDRPGAYLLMNAVRQVQTLGKFWHKQKGGTLYELLTTDANDNGINGERRFFTVTAKGEVVSCVQRICTSGGYLPGEPARTVGERPRFLQETSEWASIALQILADKRHCWAITAQEDVARATLGCMKEEVKSLLYARTLPLSETGRKRPILHLVESHRRRIKNGIDIDITAFLRGQQVVEIGGTVFTVNPPQTLRPEVSPASRTKYFSDAMQTA